jgi:hypothetical protein
MTEQLIDPSVSRVKFEREVATYRQHAADYRARGWLLLEADYPRVLIAFVKAGRPPMIVFGARLDFTNYDFWPPSVVLVDPLTDTPYLAGEVPTALVRNAAPPPNFQAFPLLQAHTPESIPFICLPGIREYHEHPAHNGDSWLRRRGAGEGTLHFILTQLSKYGLEPVNPNFQMTFAINFTHAGLPPS